MIETGRLILRLPVAADRAALHAMWADPAVMADLGPVMDAAKSDATLARHDSYRNERLGFNVVERRDDGAVIGFCGLKRGNAGTPIADQVEIGWMLAQAYWGNGYAREAAEASLAWAWANLPDDRIVAITAARNLKSQRLMERLGMQRLADGDFDHPAFAPDDPLRPTVTYAIRRP
jgi:RimJ/RimL family protein N-acetyltransferase